MTSPRLVVVDTVNGKSQVTEDFRPSPCFFMADGHKITELWYSDKSNTSACGQKDTQKEFSFNIETGAKRFIHSTFPPFSNVKDYAEKNSLNVKSDDFLVHNTTTIDFAVVLKGEINLITETGIVSLKAGDCLVQKATVHGWVNPGAETAEMLFVMIGVDVPQSFTTKHVETQIPVQVIYPAVSNSNDVLHSSIN